MGADSLNREQQTSVNTAREGTMRRKAASKIAATPPKVLSYSKLHRSRIRPWTATHRGTAPLRRSVGPLAHPARRASLSMPNPPRSLTPCHTNTHARRATSPHRTSPRSGSRRSRFPPSRGLPPSRGFPPMKPIPALRWPAPFIPDPEVAYDPPCFPGARPRRSKT